MQSFKKLAQLQGVLINLCEKNGYLYDLVVPSTWQSYCGARGRTTKEKKDKVKSVSTSSKKKESKILSLEFVKKCFNINTENDNLSDAICIGWYAVNNFTIEGNENNGKKD